MFKTPPFLLKISFVHQLFCDSFLFLLCSKEKSVGFGSDSADSSLFLSRFSYIGLRTTELNWIVTLINQSATVVTRGYESYRDCLQLAG